MKENRTCYGCIHHLACKWTPGQIPYPTPPFISDAHIGPYLKTMNEATAEACSVFEKRKDGTELTWKDIKRLTT